MVLEHLKSANLNNALSAVEETLDLDHLESLLDRGILNFESGFFLNFVLNFC